MAEEKTKVEALQDSVIDLAEVVKELSTRMDAIESRITDLSKGTVSKKGKFGGKKEKTAILDTVTDTVYPSKAATGKDLYHLVDGSPDDTFVYYKIYRAFPDRFQELPADDERAKAAWKAQEDELEEWKNQPFSEDSGNKKSKGNKK